MGLADNMKDVASNEGFQTAADAAIGAYMGQNPILANIYGGFKNAQAVNNKKKEVSNYQDDLDAWYDRKYNQNFLDSNVGSAVMTAAKERLKEANKQTENKTAITGGTVENEIAGKTANQRSFNDAAAKLTSMGTAYQDRVEGRYMRQLPMLFKTKLGIHDDDISSAQAMQENAGNLTESAANLLPLLI